MQEGCKLHLIHVAGSRMIVQGTDGLSRGDVGEGVMGGARMMSFVPLHLSVLERSPGMLQWIDHTFNMPMLEKVQLLTPEGWFEQGHDIEGGTVNEDGIWMPSFSKGRYIWTPPPAGGLVAIEQLRRARLKRQASTHIVIMPRLFTAQWRRQLQKVSDLTLELPFLPNTWEKSSQHEPLIIAFVFPFINSKPWQLKRAPAFLGMGRLLRSMWTESAQPIGPILRQLCLQAESLGSLQESVVREMLQDGSGNKLLYTQTRN